MEHLNGWTILNVKSRLDRRILAVGLANTLKVPVHETKIWEAKDAREMGITNRDDLLDAIEADGFPEFKMITDAISHEHLGKTCHIWNVCRFLRHLISTGETRMFIHDGVIFNNAIFNFTPTYAWFNEITGRLKKISEKNNVPFRVLMSGHRTPRHVPTETRPVTAGSFIVHGMLSSDNFSRIYSPEGAEYMLDRFRSNPVNSANAFLAPREHETEAFFMTPGFFSTKFPLFTDAPSDWLGANTRDNLKSYTGEYARLFPREILPEEWLTGEQNETLSHE